jgi:hypothetical protein
LHPKFEREDRHFVDGELPGGARLHRALRQRYWNKGGYVEQIPDFPFSLELIEDLEKSFDELEACERKQWKQGWDMEREVMEIVMHGTYEHYNI